MDNFNGDDASPQYNYNSLERGGEVTSSAECVSIKKYAMCCLGGYLFLTGGIVTLLELYCWFFGGKQVDSSNCSIFVNGTSPGIGDHFTPTFE